MTEESAATWRRRERAMLFALVLWALGVGAVLALRPSAFADWLLATSALEAVGTIYLTIGLLGGLCESVLLVAARWAEPANSELTEGWP